MTYERTETAVRQYQEKESINDDGRLGPKTLDSLGVKQGTAGTEFSEAGENVKHSYSKGRKEIGHGAKDMGTDLKRGDVVQGAKDLGKGVGKGAAHIGVGTGHAVKNAAKGATNAGDAYCFVLFDAVSPVTALRIFRLKSATDVKMPRARRSRWILANHTSTWLSHDE